MSILKQKYKFTPFSSTQMVSSDYFTVWHMFIYLVLAFHVYYTAEHNLFYDQIVQLQ